MEAQGESPVSAGSTWRSSAALIGDPYTASCSGAAPLDPEEAEECHPGFFCGFAGAQKPCWPSAGKKGRFRSYLLGALKYFLADERRRVMAIKRGKGQRLIPLEELKPRRDEPRWNLRIQLTAEQIYERRWASHSGAQHACLDLSEE